METILSDLSVSMTEFKRNPNDTLRESNGHTVAVLSHNKPAFYMVPPERYEAMLEQLDDLHSCGWQRGASNNRGLRSSYEN